MSDSTPTLLEAAEAFLYVVGNDHSQGEYDTAHGTLAAAVLAEGGTLAAPTVAPAPGFSPSATDVAVADTTATTPDTTTPAAAPADTTVAPAGGASEETGEAA